MSVGYLQQDLEPGGEARRKQYACDVTYGTNSEFGFDYLRDNMKERADLQVQGPLDFAIVDEVDSVADRRGPHAFDHQRRSPRRRRQVQEGADARRPGGDRKEQAVGRRSRRQGDIGQADRSRPPSGDADKAKDKAEKDAAHKRQTDAEKQLEEAEKKKEGVTQYYEVELDRKIRPPHP